MIGEKKDRRYGNRKRKGVRGEEKERRGRNGLINRGEIGMGEEQGEMEMMESGKEKKMGGISRKKEEKERCA